MLGVELSRLNISELKTLLKVNNLDTRGNKNELILRLQQNVAEYSPDFAEDTEQFVTPSVASDHISPQDSVSQQGSHDTVATKSSTSSARAKVAAKKAALEQKAHFLEQQQAIRAERLRKRLQEQEEDLRIKQEYERRKHKEQEEFEKRKRIEQEEFEKRKRVEQEEFERRKSKEREEELQLQQERMRRKLREEEEELQVQQELERLDIQAKICAAEAEEQTLRKFQSSSRQHSKVSATVPKVTFTSTPVRPSDPMSAGAQFDEQYDYSPPSHCNATGLCRRSIMMVTLCHHSDTDISQGLQVMCSITMDIMMTILCPLNMTSITLCLLSQSIMMT